MKERLLLYGTDEMAARTEERMRKRKQQGMCFLLWLRCGLHGIAFSSGTHAFLCQAVSKGHFTCILFLFQEGVKPTILN